MRRRRRRRIPRRRLRAWSQVVHAALESKLIFGCSGVTGLLGVSDGFRFGRGCVGVKIDPAVVFGISGGAVGIRVSEDVDDEAGGNRVIAVAPAGHVAFPHRQGSRVARAASAPRASARRWARVRGSWSQTLFASAATAWRRSAASGVESRPQILVVPVASLGSPTVKSRPRAASRARRTAPGSCRWMAAPIASSSLYCDSGPQCAAAAVIVASIAASALSSVTNSVRRAMVSTVRRGGSPARNKAPSCGKRSRKVIAQFISPDAQPCQTVSAQDSSAAQASQSSQAQSGCSSLTRRRTNSAIGRALTRLGGRCRTGPVDDAIDQLGVRQPTESIGVGYCAIAHTF